MRVQEGLKYLSCNAITAMKIAGGIRLTMREDRELIPYFRSPMLLNLYKNVCTCTNSFYSGIHNIAICIASENLQLL